ncbi:MAG: acyl-CoA thioesterase [Actinomycetales bacterium]
MRDRDLTLRFLAAPFDVNVHGSVPGGVVLEWIDKAGYAVAAAWSGQYCVTAYVGNIHFIATLAAGDLVEVRARVVRTGRSSMTVLAEVHAGNPRSGSRWEVARCAMVFVGTDGKGRTVQVPSWQPQTEEDVRLADDALALAGTRRAIDEKMAEAVYTDGGRGERLTLRFLARPTDVNYGGKVHGGTVMFWIDEAAEACAARWSGRNAIAVYAGGVRFYQPMFIGDLVEVEARLLHTEGTRMHVSVHVRSGSPKTRDLRLTTHCLMVLDSLDDEGRVTAVRTWVPETEEDVALDRHAVELEEVRASIGHQELFTRR